MTLVVRQGFWSGTKHNVWIEPGVCGTIKKFHDTGHAYVKFVGHKQAQWVRQQHFWKLACQHDRVREAAALQERFALGRDAGINKQRWAF